MIKPIFRINNTVVNPPINYEELSLELNFDKDDPSYNGQVTTNNWVLGLGDSNDPKDGTKIALDYINGGLGVFEGIGFGIDLVEKGNINKLFEGYLDLSKAAITCKSIEATATETGRIDWLNNIADSFTFEYLYSEDGLAPNRAGKILTSDFVPVPYLLTSIPDIYTAAITGMTLYTVLNNFIEAISSLVEKIPELIFPNFGNIVSLILVSIQLTLLMIASIILMVQLYKLLVPKVKYHGGMYVHTLCERASQYLGLEFKSTILESDPFNRLLVMPETFQQFEPKDNAKKRFINFSKTLIGVQDILDFERVGFYRGTFGDLLRELKNTFNAKLILTDDVLRLERIDYIDRPSTYTIPDVDRANMPYRFNYEEYYSNYNLAFTVDLSDSNVVQNYTGNEAKITTAPLAVRYKGNLVGGVEKKIQLGFARGIRRTKKNFIEKMFADVFDNIDPIISVLQAVRKQQKKDADKIKAKLNKIKDKLSKLGIKFKKPKKPKEGDDKIDKYITDLRDLLFRKSNVLLLEKDAVNVPKLLLMEATYANWKDEAFVKLDIRNDDIVNASYLYDNFHNINTFVGANSNQHKIYEVDNLPFCFKDYDNVKNNNIVFDSDGITKATIMSIKWNVFAQTASIKYKIKDKYTSNLYQSKIVSDGR